MTQQQKINKAKELQARFMDDSTPEKDHDLILMELESTILSYFGIYGKRASNLSVETYQKYEERFWKEAK